METVTEQPIKKIEFFRCPQSLPGVAPLTKKPEDSGYEIEKPMTPSDDRPTSYRFVSGRKCIGTYQASVFKLWPRTSAINFPFSDNYLFTFIQLTGYRLMASGALTICMKKPVVPVGNKWNASFQRKFSGKKVTPSKAHSVFFIRTSNLGAEAERSYIFLRFEAENVLKMFLN